MYAVIQGPFSLFSSFVITDSALVNIYLSINLSIYLDPCEYFG